MPGRDASALPIRCAALVAAQLVGRLPRRRDRRRRRRLGRRLDVGPPARDLRAVGAADLRRLDGARRPRRRHDPDPARADGRREHVPEPGRDREARDDPRPHQRRPGDPGHRRRVVRAGARRVRHRLRRERRRAARPVRRGGDAPAPPARRRADRPTTRAGSIGCTTRCASRGRSSRACRSSIGGSGPTKTLRTAARYGDAWNTNGTLDEVRDERREPRAAMRGDRPRPGRDRTDGQLPDRHPRHARGGRDRLRREDAAERDAGRGTVPNLLGPPADIAEAIRPYRDELGFRHVIVRMPAPHDLETIARIGEVRALLED